MPEPKQPEETNLMELTRGYDWRPIVMLALILAFVGYTMWLYR